MRGLQQYTTTTIYKSYATRCVYPLIGTPSFRLKFSGTCFGTLLEEQEAAAKLQPSDVEKGFDLLVEAIMPELARCPTCGAPMRVVMRLWTSERACIDTG